MPGLRLFCLPYSGASAMVYARWRRRLPTWLEVRPVELPGRGVRAAEPFAEDAVALAGRLAMELLPQLDAPYALFGHSLGSLLAFEVAHALRQHGAPAPRALFVSGGAAPARRDFQDYARPKSDDELVERLRALKGTPEEVFAHRELLEMALPILRADFLLCGRYRHQIRAPLDLPIHVLGGHEDDVEPEDLQAWGEETRGPCSVDLFDGHHFFIHEREPEVLALLERHGHAYARPASPHGAARAPLPSH
ncbi:thioesterase [Pseudomonas mangiferae]|uniref:Thioesterase n=2 Tax=Pseudomonas mangiferae TaxID=2593654 RepID=A0A553H4V9_9PSED|nr:thioesterase [Pseudomonas mangiferae]